MIEDDTPYAWGDINHTIAVRWSSIHRETIVRATGIFDNRATKERRLSIALAVFQITNIIFEIAQNKFPWSLPNLLAKSDNSEEDKPSNLVGFSRAVYDNDSGKKMKDGDLRKDCGGVGIDEGGIKLSLCVYEVLGGFKESKSWSPNDYNETNNSLVSSGAFGFRETVGPMKWPTKFSSIQPACDDKDWLLHIRGKAEYYGTMY